jgi:hypothetical protein
VVLAALAPVIISRYDVAGHGLWLPCSLVALVVWLGLWVVTERTPEAQEAFATYSWAQNVALSVFFLLFIIPMVGALILVALGLFPDQEPAIYITAVGLGLSLGALALLMLVLSQRRPRPASDAAELPATGGSSA